MNEKLQNLLDMVRRTALQAGDLAADAVYGAGQMADDLLSSAKLRVKAATLEGDIDAKLTEIGGMVYATHTGSPTESEALLSKLQEIDRLKAELRDLNDALGRAPEVPVCPTCGAAVREGDAYCRQCGGKL